MYETNTNNTIIPHIYIILFLYINRINNAKLLIGFTIKLQQHSQYQNFKYFYHVTINHYLITRNNNRIEQNTCQSGKCTNHL